MHALDILERGYTLLFQKISEAPEREGMPFKGLWAMVLAAVIEKVLFDGRTQSTFRTL